MARYASDGMVRVFFVPTIADLAAPTVAELDAGVDLSTFIPKDGLTTPANRNNVDDDALSDTFDGMVPGTWGGDLQVTMKRDNASDDAWNLVVYGLEGNLVVRRGIPFDTTWTAADPAEVYPGAWHQKTMQATAANTQARFDTSFPVASPGPEVDAVVAA